MHLKTQERVPKISWAFSLHSSLFWYYVLQAVSCLDLPGLPALYLHLKETSKLHLRYSRLHAL